MKDSKVIEKGKNGAGYRASCRRAWSGIWGSSCVNSMSESTNDWCGRWY